MLGCGPGGEPIVLDEPFPGNTGEMFPGSMPSPLPRNILQSHHPHEYRFFNYLLLLTVPVIPRTIAQEQNT
jgi:hypothetical protein